MNPRRLVLVILVGGAAAMGLIFLVVNSYLRRAAVPNSDMSAADARALTASGQRELREGNVRLALKKLNAAIEQRSRNPNSLSRDELHKLKQLRRESELLAQLLNDPLEEILQQALQIRNEDEWREKFEDYRGRSVLFEDVLRSDAAGRPMLGIYVLRAGDVEARIALEDLTLLRDLPLDPPRRWLFGARLASCRREEGGVWIVRFEPESGVLLTDEAAASACWPGPVDDELRDVLTRQDKWLRR
ncbi:MAG TPA: hypothetical protein VH643_28095 [Gemmataceae bacterium]